MKLDDIFGPSDGPFQAPDQLTESLDVDPWAGGEIVLDAIERTLGWIGHFLLTAEGVVIVGVVVFVIILFALPTNEGGPAR